MLSFLVCVLFEKTHQFVFFPVCFISIKSSHAFLNVKKLNLVLHQNISSDSVRHNFFFCSLLSALPVISNFPTMNLYDILYPKG